MTLNGDLKFGMAARSPGGMAQVDAKKVEADIGQSLGGPPPLLGNVRADRGLHVRGAPDRVRPSRPTITISPENTPLQRMPSGCVFRRLVPPRRN